MEFGLSSDGTKSARDHLMLFGGFMVALAVICVKMICDPLLSLGTRLLTQNGEA
jgi:hypothetical protein